MESWNRMADFEKKKALAEYVRQLADLVGLRDWAFEVECKPDEYDDDTIASVSVQAVRHLAFITTWEMFDAKTAEEQRMAMVHELLHCHFTHVDEPIGQDLRNSGTLAGAAHDLFYTGFHRQLECTVDAIAVPWSRLLPLPPWENGDDR